MNESQEHRQGMLPAHDQAPELGQPREGAFDFPASAIAAQLAPILGGWSSAAPAMRDDQFDAPPFQTSAQGIAVIGLVRNHSFRFLPWTATAGSGDRNRGQGGFQQGHFRRRGRFQEDSQRNTLAVDHHQTLCALASLSFAHAWPPFLAGMKVASAKASLQSSRLRWSKVARKARQISSQRSSSSHRRSRRQQVDGLGYRSGRSCQRAPVRKIHRMPSITARLEAQGRPPFLDLGKAGKSGSICFHCLSVRSGLRGRWAIVAPPTSFCHTSSVYASPFIEL
jgi:hypothetical protein